MTEETRERWQAARRVLCVRLDTIGDVLMTGPAIRGLKEQRADRRVSLLTSRAGAAAGRLLPGVDEVIVYDPPWMKATAPRADPGPDLRLAGALRERGFDAAAISPSTARARSRPRCCCTSRGCRDGSRTAVRTPTRS